MYTYEYDHPRDPACRERRTATLHGTVTCSSGSRITDEKNATRPNESRDHDNLQYTTPRAHLFITGEFTHTRARVLRYAVKEKNIYVYI